jgi:hypothetical protein
MLLQMLLWARMPVVTMRAQHKLVLYECLAVVDANLSSDMHTITAAAAAAAGSPGK